MELTPEERQKIYEEEKARLEARKAREVETPVGKAGRGGLLGCLGLIGGTLVLTLIISLLPKSEKTQAPHYSESQLLNDINSSSEIEQLKQAGIIYDVRSYGSGVYVLVGSTFYSLSFDQKKGALMMVASVVGKARGGDQFVLYDYQTNKDIGYWSSRWGLHLK